MSNNAHTHLLCSALHPQDGASVHPGGKRGFAPQEIRQGPNELFKTLPDVEVERLGATGNGDLMVGGVPEVEVHVVGAVDVAIVAT